VSERTRPGGLTALAVINIVFCGSGLLGVLGMAALFALMGKMADEVPEKSRQQFEALQKMGGPRLVFMFGLSLVTSVLLLLSGIGYLKQKRVLGRLVGNSYAVIAVVSSLVRVFLFAPELGGGFTIGTIIGLVYPVLTLVLLNTTFKDDLAN